jgi:hypothetical protein
MAMKVKGSVFIPWVKVIKANKTGAYDNYLTNKDREIIDERILPNIWYPFETYKNCLNAVFEVLAKKDLEVATGWGRTFSKQVMSGLYEGTLEGLTPLDYLKRIGTLHKNFFNFGKIEIVFEAEKQVVYKLLEYDRQFVPLQYILRGWVEGSLSLCGAKNIKTEILTKTWEGAPFTSMRFTWT